MRIAERRGRNGPAARHLGTICRTEWPFFESFLTATQEAIASASNIGLSNQPTWQALDG